MKQYRLFSLDERLACCGKFVRKNAKVVDVGTDHAYLPIYLVKTGIITHAIASDLREGPLANAEKNINRYGLAEHIKTVLSNGLENVSETEADDIIISGMGGEVIIDIIKNAKWLKNTDKRLILQPMSEDEKLRDFLKDNKFFIEREEAVISKNKVYTVMSVKYVEQKFNVQKLYTYIGQLKAHSSLEAATYIQKKIKSLEKRAIGLKTLNKTSEYVEICEIIEELKRLIERNNLHGYS